MATKKSVNKPKDNTSYGNKSGPPRKAVKEMMSKQSEPSSKDALHGAKPKSKVADEASILLHFNQKGPLKLKDIIDGQAVYGSVGSGKTMPGKAAKKNPSQK